MKDLSYLQAFPTKVLRSMRRVLKCGFTLEDVETFLENPDAHQKPVEGENALAGRLEKPCCGDSKIDKELAEARAKQKERKAKKEVDNGYSNTVKP